MVNSKIQIDKSGKNTKKKVQTSVLSHKLQEKSLISKDMTIGEILEICPASAIIMASYGLHCVGCAISTSETLEGGCRAHMLPDEDIDKLVKEINEEIKNNI